MDPIHAYLPNFHPAQTEIAYANYRYKVVAAGRRFGKGVLTVVYAIIYASRGGKCRWIAPSYASDSFQSGWSMAKELAAQIPGADVHLQRKELSFSSRGGWLQFRTAEDAETSLRGEGIDFVAFDEAAHIVNLQDLWEQAVRPSLMDRCGDAWFISTPRGYNYFNTLFNRSRIDQDWFSWQFPTSSNPHIEKREIEALRASLPHLVAKQEIDAEFVQLADAMFKRQNINILSEAPLGVSWVRSWDLAFTVKSASDYTAGVKMGMTADGTVVIADVIIGQMEWPDAVRCVANTARLDGPTVRQGIEVVGAQIGALQELMRDPLLLNHTFTPIEVQKDKLTRALPLIARSEQGKLALVAGHWNQTFIDELCGFPEGQHDEQVPSTI